MRAAGRTRSTAPLRTQISSGFSPPTSLYAMTCA
jgi:hypothetical protein